ncbi:monovalent cation/H+ antiporter subunit A [Zwartia sp.]|uniref:monovalent cation/H+ antiporter subunit A n=1 Tax=Zwartia sp. TaxID=2978004 RepID=UPI002724F1BC|nr:monovalent cation/H+ antiporter subunit A [Zwartia sp.]MDO9023299.1 monovalent cation/H+ antiporter subunit A [Zwartia sp.]
MTLLTIILLPLLAGTTLALLAARMSRAASAWAVAGVTLCSLGLLLGFSETIFSGQKMVSSIPWMPELGINFSFRLDGLSYLFTLLILCIGLLIILYAKYYLSEKDSIGKFYALLMMFMAAMLGIVLTENILLTFVFWELTSVSSFLLIGFWNHKAESRRGARMALTVTGGGGLAMLAGFLLLGHVAGSYELTQIFAAREVVQSSPLYMPILILILLGAFTKSAQFPFHFWLPQAMAAPTPVSAYLHSATMVKAGVFMLARLYPVLGGTYDFEIIVSCIGLITMVFAAYVAIFKHDLKGLLAYSTISHLGLIIFLIGLSSPLSAAAAVFHIINHATFKASLFMVAGIIDHECGTRDMRRLRGLFKFMPYTATLAMVAAASMAGVPLFNGFLSKEMFFVESLALEHLGWFGEIAPWAVTFGGMFSVAYSARFVHNVFFNGTATDLPHTPHEPPRFMKVPVEILIVLCIVIGVLPALTVAPLVFIAAFDVFGGPIPDYTIAIWHGFNTPLLMSALALTGGLLMFWLLQHHFKLHLYAPKVLQGHRVFVHVIESLLALARGVTQYLQNGSLQRYLALLVASVIVLGAWPFLQYGYNTGDAPLTPANAVAVVIWAVAIIGAVATAVMHRQRIIAVILVGVVGLATALTFAYFSAPDLALTQLSVEVVSTALMLMALALLPLTGPKESNISRRSRDIALSVLAGAGVTALMWAVLTRPNESIAWYYLAESVARGGGSNVVNVILVDFRGFDTFGEIIVLGIAAIGALSLMDGLKMERNLSPALLNPVLLSVAARILLPFALLVSVYIFLRGHNLPGGGFIAGLITSVALVMQYMAGGLVATSSKLRIEFPKVIGGGVMIAGLTGLGSFVFGSAFLTSTFGYPLVPLIGEVPLASAAAFDLGVFLTVVGATMLTISALSGASQRSGDVAGVTQ